MTEEIPRVRYRIPDEVLTARLEGEAVLLHMDTKRYYQLNETGSWIWKGLQQQKGREELIEHVCRRFEIGAEEAECELDEFLAHLREQELLTVQQGDPSEEDLS